VLRDVYEVEFRIGKSEFAGKWNEFSNTRKCNLIAEDVDDIITNWVKVLIKVFPFEEELSRSHYSEPAIYGDKVKFISIKLLHEKVILNSDCD
jgi:hypothetical protein